MDVSNAHLHSMENNSDSFMKGVRACVPTLLGYLGIGLAAGVIEKAAGLSIIEIALMSLLLYAGSSQFIAAGMVATSSPYSAIIITVFLVNLRHILLSTALSPYFKHLSLPRNMLIGTLLTDETFGVAINEATRKHQLSEKWMHGLNITAYVNWLIANVAGGFLAQWISNPEKFGLAYALPAMFIGILVLTILGRGKIKLDIFIVMIAVIIAVGSSFMLSASMGIIIATIIGATTGMVVEKWR